MKKFLIVMMVVAALLIGSAASHAAIWFTGTIVSVLVKTDGTVEIVLDTGTVEKWGKITPDAAPQWKSMLAVALTAKANGATVEMRKEGVLWDMIQLSE